MLRVPLRLEASPGPLFPGFVWVERCSALPRSMSFRDLGHLWQAEAHAYHIHPIGDAG